MNRQENISLFLPRKAKEETALLNVAGILAQKKFTTPKVN